VVREGMGEAVALSDDFERPKYAPAGAPVLSPRGTDSGSVAYKLQEDFKSLRGYFWLGQLILKLTFAQDSPATSPGPVDPNAVTFSLNDASAALEAAPAEREEPGGEGAPESACAGQRRCGGAPGPRCLPLAPLRAWEGSLLLPCVAASGLPSPPPCLTRRLYSQRGPLVS